MNDDAVKKLAVSVIKKAVDDGESNAPFLEFWCEVVGIEYSIFLKKLTGLGERSMPRSTHS